MIVSTLRLIVSTALYWEKLNTLMEITLPIKTRFELFFYF